jgi:hypothetical protein
MCEVQESLYRLLVTRFGIWQWTQHGVVLLPCPVPSFRARSAWVWSGQWLQVLAKASTERSACGEDSRKLTVVYDRSLS